MNAERNRRILVIDDNPAIHGDFRKVLEQRGPADGLDQAEADLFGGTSITPQGIERFEIDSAFQGPEALELVRRALANGQPYALAFVDVRMPPGWDGIETTGRIWKEYPELQVVICTAHSDYLWQDVVESIGLSDQLVVLKKPFDKIEVLQLAHALTGKWSLTRQARARLEDLEKMVLDRTRHLQAANDDLQREIRERIQAQQERDAMEVQLRQKQKLEAVGRLAAGIAHEVNTPTQYIGDNTRFLRETFAGVLDLLQRQGELVEAARHDQVTPEMLDSLTEATRRTDLDFLREEIPKAIEQSLEGVARVSQIVGAMKDFSHPGSDEKTPTDLNHAIESTVTVARSEWKYVADLNLDLDPALPAVPVLAGEFNQMILNLVVNSAHAIADKVGDGSAGKGTITLRTRRQGDWAELRVTDTGTGIPAHAQDKVFTPFFTTKPVGKGTGQGLALARSFVEDKQGGTIAFSSEEGVGATFVIRLPLAKTAGPARPAGTPDS